MIGWHYQLNGHEFEQTPGVGDGQGSLACCSTWPIYFGKGTKCMVIEAFDKRLFATVEDSIFALEEIPEVQSKSVNFDEILPEEPKRIYIPRMTHSFKRQSFEKFIEKQNIKIQKELEKQAS